MEPRTPGPSLRWQAHERMKSMDRRDAVAALAAAILVVTGFGPTTPASPPSNASPTAAADLKEVYAAIEDQVVAIRGLTPKAPVDPQVLDDAGIKKFVSDSFSKDNPAEVVAANERLLKAFDLLPADASLKDLYLNLLGSQVAGLYSPDDKKLYVVSRSGGLGPAEKTAFAHEF